MYQNSAMVARIMINVATAPPKATALHVIAREVTPLKAYTVGELNEV
jgi:hypothetical protein